jgi:putative tryptophan/tyrosine transport system substrate-binding protein
LTSKQLALASELLPQGKSAAVLINPTYSLAEIVSRDALQAGRALARQVEIISASSTASIEASFERMHSNGVGGVLVTVDPFLFHPS